MKPGRALNSKLAKYRHRRSRTRETKRVLFKFWKEGIWPITRHWTDNECWWLPEQHHD